MFLQSRNRLTATGNKFVVTKGEREGGEGQIRGMGLTGANYYI